MVKITWLIALVGALFFLGADSWRKYSAFRAATEIGERGRPAPALDAASPTGFDGGRRNQVLQSADGYHWVMQTQQMIARGEWRVRHVDYDNAPEGRDVHWSSPLHAWLALVAWVDHAVTGRPWLVAVEHAALHAGPLLLAVFLIATVPWIARRFGGGPAALLALGSVAVVPFSGEFGTGSFDHHGVAAACALLTVLFLLAGWIAPSGESRRCFVASGIAGAAGLWINAATQIPVLVGVGLGALAAQRVTRASAAVDPRMWRTWGFAGGVASLLFYLIEYFPSHLGWRLEVNHPLYAFAWIGAGDWLARAGGRARGEPWWSSPRDRSAAFTWLFMLVFPALLVVLDSARVFVVADKFLWTLHVDYISEFAPLTAGLGNPVIALAVASLVLGLVMAALWLWRGALAPGHRALLALAGAPAALVMVLALSQQRWLHVAAALGLGLLVAVAFVTTRPEFLWTGWRRAAAALFLSLLLLPYPIRAGIDAFRPAGLSRENIRQYAVRDLAYWLRRHTGIEPVTVLAGPTATTELVYHGGFRGVGTLYWENLSGLRDTIGILGAGSADHALEILRRRGVTHLVLLPWGSFVEESARLAQGLRAGATATGATFGRDVINPGAALPDWLRPLPYRLPEAEAFKGEVAFVFEVVPDQTPVEAAVHNARYLAAMGLASAAHTLVQQALASQPSHITALVTLAQLQRTARDRSAHNVTVERLRPLLRTDPDLAPDVRVDLAWELAAQGIAGATYAQVMRAWADASERDLRRLPPETLGRLLRLTRDFKATPPPDSLAVAEGVAAGDQPAASR